MFNILDEKRNGSFSLKSLSTENFHVIVVDFLLYEMKQFNFANLFFPFFLFVFVCREQQTDERDFDSNWPIENCLKAANMEMKINGSMGGYNRMRPHLSLLKRRHSLPEIIMRK